MRNSEQEIKMKTCLEHGYRIYAKPIDNYSYRIVIAKATKYKWSDIPKEKHKEYEQVDGVIYSLKIGDMVYRANPKDKDPKWYEKIPELYENIYNKISKS